MELWLKKVGSLATDKKAKLKDIKIITLMIM